MMSNLSVLLRRYHTHRTARIDQVQAAVAGGVACMVQRDAHPAEPSADCSPHWRVVLADAASGYQPVDAVQRGDHRCDLLAYRAKEHRNRKLRIGMRRAGRMQQSHITGYTGIAEQSATMVDPISQHSEVVMLLPQQIQQDARVEITAARRHEDAAGRRQTQAGIA